MSSLRRRIETVMRSGPDENMGLTGAVLRLVSLVYGLVMRLRYKLYQKGFFKTGKAPCMVVSVGNITVGGTGKTPMAIYLARLFNDWGLNVAIASRGYGGTMQKQGGAASDGKDILLTPAEAGDEPWLMAVKLPGVPVVVGGDRVKSANLCASQFGTRILILDDAFSRLAIDRDLNLLLVDSQAPFGNGHVFPRGLLREPAEFASRADAVIRTRADRGAGQAALPQGKPVFSCTHKPKGFLEYFPQKGTSGPKIVRHSLDDLKGKKVAAFAGIADNQGFFDGLSSLGVAVLDRLSFPDHHAYTLRDRNIIVETAIKADVKALITTEKDLVRLTGWDAHGLDLYALEIALEFEQAQKFEDFLKSKLQIGE
ncbi:tetraacyldisaccharide 4'-kinase [Desulfatibacillum aliphaticivorans]|uniref:Tetraacyldisaccharide 4'-kinase n=1 Tax=Desulfatibacillum aliphaticivorans TaxID=218208 RepID=LPXK_DESAL|nr:tetraacyldisaccharide 4'-kinase [Desulfatibacillum aliphaticivorans]B8F928.1 RecName: Full=Tetraacyldisaccharide 4'-kinase; AltName: Full=Lipid A 4'-kinase [Desulfatibacillum aliphaticivorans]ACL02060.1 tetraacyldisaccharide 4'-kinase [Desulfatibacillum aliphaticivorans]